MNLRFACPVCDSPGRLDPATTRDWHCPACDHVVHLEDEAEAHACRLCGNRELYRKKDFPHTLGMTILGVAVLASCVTYWLRYPWLTWAILIGSAVVDGLLFLWVGDVSVCYRCGAEHRGLPADVTHPPFELTVHERYRQERIRREQLQAEKKSPG